MVKVFKMIKMWHFSLYLKLVKMTLGNWSNLPIQARISLAHLPSKTNEAIDVHFIEMEHFNEFSTRQEQITKYRQVLDRALLVHFSSQSKQAILVVYLIKLDVHKVHAGHCKGFSLYLIRP